MTAYHEATDRNLLDAWRGGDARAFEALVERHEALVSAACRRQLPADAIDDAVQAVFIVLTRRADQASAAPALEAWLLRTAWLVCLQARRNHAIRRRQEREAAASIAPVPSCAAFEDPDGVLPVLDAAMQELPERQRAALTLQFFVGCSQAEIAARLGMRTNAAKQLVHRGIEGLRERLRQRGVMASALAVAAVCSTQRGEAAEAIAVNGAGGLAPAGAEQLAGRVVMAESLAEQAMAADVPARALPMAALAGAAAVSAVAVLAFALLPGTPADPVASIAQPAAAAETAQPAGLVVPVTPVTPVTPVSPAARPASAASAPPAQTASQPEVGADEIAPPALAQALAAGTVTLLDCSGSVVHAKARIPGAIDVEAHMLTIAPLLPATRDALLVVYAVDGESRNHAPVAAELRRVGYRQVRVLAGGLQGWIAVGGRVEGTAVRYHP